MAVVSNPGRLCHIGESAISGILVELVRSAARRVIVTEVSDSVVRQIEVKVAVIVVVGPGSPQSRRVIRRDAAGSGAVAEAQLDLQAASKTLSQKLEELEEAKALGYVQQAEYEAARAKLLNFA